MSPYLPLIVGFIPIVIGLLATLALVLRLWRGRKMPPPINVINGLLLPDPDDTRWVFRQQNDVTGKPTNILVLDEVGVALACMQAWVGNGGTGFIPGSTDYSHAVLTAYRQRLSLKSIEGIDSNPRN